MPKTKIQGFTLAEVLITLVIIGVVAALTIPNLMQKYQEQTTVKKVQKFYSTLSNAYALAKKENGPVSDWGVTGYNSESTEKVYEFLFKPYFKIAKNCGTTNTGNCIKNERYKSLRNTVPGGTAYGGSQKHYKFNLDDGSSVIFYSNIIFVYDANGGTNGPNQWGKDTFLFYVSDDSNKILPFGLSSPAYFPFYSYCTSAASDDNSGLGCAAWVVYKGNMDYLHCGDKLTWKSHSCKDN